MCGIAGWIGRTGDADSEAIVRAMTGAVAHRGPDGDGIWRDGRVAFGHRRLSIIDLSDAGAQPMALPGAGLTITYNGEIYNYRELRRELEALGRRFRSDSDTEVILGAYDQWGAACVSRFNGMWAFAIHDRPRGIVFCSRDRFGVKPFYYVDTPSCFAFGSEMRQLLPLLPTRTVDRELTTTFIVTGALDLDARTMFAGVRKLPAGHNATYDLARRTLSIERFYEVRRDESVGRLSAEDAQARLRELLESAVALRLRSDVKVGTCLSGGLDSSSVATLAAAQYAAANGGRFSAITAVSEEAETDETRYAEIVARASGLDWHTVKPTYADFCDSLPAVVSAQEEPFGSPSLTMQYLVMRTARANGITVMLDGQGGDEVLLGYDKYLGAYVTDELRSGGPLAALRAVRAIGRNNERMRPRALAKYLLGSRLGRIRYALDRRRHAFMRDVPSISPHIAAFSAAGSDPFALQQLEIRSTNLPVLLRYEDKNSMAHGVEARLPFLDYRLLEFAVSLPIGLKLRDGWSKWLLRSALSDRLPAEIAWRRNKLSFDAPERTWLGRHLSEMREAVAASPLLGEIADRSALVAAYDGMSYRSRWRLYSLALWEKSFGVGG
jgi:asparagine synthase (glutamine-hydrolysing)